jgi:hypothetical protein
MNIPQIENILRLAPKPAPPTGLKDRLIAQLRLPAAQPASQTPVVTLAPASWLRRWWPVLAPATVSIACAAVLTVQQMEICDLKQASLALSRDLAAKASAFSAPTAQTNDVVSGAAAAARTQQEIARLKELAGQLAAEVAQLEQRSAENAKLRTQLAAPPAGLFTPEETDALAKAKERAERIACINNLKQLCLAARILANDSGGMSPPDILSMTNAIGSPKILVCPGDHGREAAKDWASYTSANCSYEYLTPSVHEPETEPSRMMFHCPIHGNWGLCDGSVQVIAKDHPEMLVRRNGKIYLAEPTEPAQGAPAPPSGNPPPGGSNP